MNSISRNFFANTLHFLNSANLTEYSTIPLVPEEKEECLLKNFEIYTQNFSQEITSLCNRIELSSTNKKDVLLKIQKIVDAIFSDPSIDNIKKLHIGQKTKTLFSSFKSSIDTIESLPVLITDNQNTTQKIPLSYLQFSQSTLLQSLCCKAAEAPISLKLPVPTSIEDFYNLSRIDALETKEELFLCLLVADYFGLNEEINLCLEKLTPILDIEEIKQFFLDPPIIFNQQTLSILVAALIEKYLNENLSLFQIINYLNDESVKNKFNGLHLDLNLSNIFVINQISQNGREKISGYGFNYEDANSNKKAQYQLRLNSSQILEIFTRFPCLLSVNDTSFLVNIYIRTSLSEGLSIAEITSMMSQESFQKKIQDIPLDLNLSNLPITENCLIALSQVINNVRSLDLKRCQFFTFPAAWTNTLKYLNIENSTLTEFSHTFPLLEFFHAYSCKSLSNISGLDEAKKLQFVSLERTLVTRAPHNCLSLKYFFASSSCLNDVAALDNLINLRSLDVSNTFVTRAPIGCISLKEFRASSCSLLIDIYGLNDLRDLELISVNRTKVRSAPERCFSLQIFDAHHNNALTDIKGLEGLAKLEYLEASYTGIKFAPKGCISLKNFNELEK
ncbi:MAG: hypothetical protein FJZ56_02970 [Chlamydiae bacterium]|nr:hypothetical protein [Chlamydiota bacterium]